MIVMLSVVAMSLVVGGNGGDVGCCVGGDRGRTVHQRRWQLPQRCEEAQARCGGEAMMVVMVMVYSGGGWFRLSGGVLGVEVE